MKAKMSILLFAKVSEMKTERSAANSDRMLSVQRFNWMDGPGLVSMSPERKTKTMRMLTDC